VSTRVQGGHNDSGEYTFLLIVIKEKEMIRPATLPVYCVIIMFLISFLFVNAYAEEPGGNGFSGCIFIGGGYATGDLSLDDASEDNYSRINSLNQSSKKHSEFVPIIGGALSYTFASSETTLSLGYEGMPTMAISQPVKDVGIFSFGVSYGGEGDVWEDPFVTGTNRATTEEETFSYSLAWNEILDTNFAISYGIKTIGIDNDLAGRRDNRLKRDGNIHTLHLGHPLFGNETHNISAGLTLEVADLSGKSNAYNGVGFDLSHTIGSDKWDITTEMSFVFRDHDGFHPEFNKTREDSETMLKSTYTRKNLFGWEGYFSSLYVSYAVNNSNINFYDSSDISTGMIVGYTF
jgi:hypothetical protein